ncbi:hypothetical protein HID58_042515 [Brassica napus]|uniref:Rhodopsin n=1 Tax=Brassica napus TaxID=3708 RepID=A0ABQ8BDX4_BRANA|nr:hypothetical protein HID58_042515 [Brassica napus]
MILAHERTCLLSPKPPLLSLLPPIILFLFHFTAKISRGFSIVEKKMYQDQQHPVGAPPPQGYPPPQYPQGPPPQYPYQGPPPPQYGQAPQKKKKDKDSGFVEGWCFGYALLLLSLGSLFLIEGRDDICR